VLQAVNLGPDSASSEPGDHPQTDELSLFFAAAPETWAKDETALVGAQDVADGACGTASPSASEMLRPLSFRYSNITLRVASGFTFLSSL